MTMLDLRYCVYSSEEKNYRVFGTVKEHWEQILRKNQDLREVNKDPDKKNSNLDEIVILKKVQSVVYHVSAIQKTTTKFD